MPSRLLKLHNHTLAFNTQTLGDKSPSQLHPLVARQARRWRGRAGGGKQVRGMDDWTHVWPIRGGGSGREASGDGRRRGSGSTVAAARVAVKCWRC
jgi:hypothetical protein